VGDVVGDAFERYGAVVPVSDDAGDVLVHEGLQPERPVLVHVHEFVEEDRASGRFKTRDPRRVDQHEVLGDERRHLVEVEHRETSC